MTQLSIQKTKQEGILFYLLLLTVFFLLLEVSFFIQCNSAYFLDDTFASSSLHIPISILPGILFFIFAQLSIHFIYCLFIYLIVQLIKMALPSAAKHQLTLGIKLWFLGLLTALTANQFYFPHSKYSALSSVILINPFINKIVFILLFSLCLLMLTLALIGLIKNFTRISISLMLIIFMGIGFLWLPSQSALNKSFAHPNIIFISVDSLRPDFLSYFGYPQSTAFFDNFLQHSTVFTEAITPLARTFPSWFSILSGRYPRETQVRSNLASQENLNLTETLPAILQRHGYETIYATDETRFSNIDKNFGFDRIISPPMGLNDFILGNFNDFPLSNLLINTPIGKWLFPHSYANRAAFATYEPNSFLNLMKPILQASKTKPLFFAVHFCLPHFPYFWASFADKAISPQARYFASVQRIDKQAQDFFALLKQSHLLDHAIVVLLSDHGEALELSGDRITETHLFMGASDSIPKFYPPSLDAEAINQSVGHGTDVLGLTQYHSVLAFQLFGMPHSTKTVSETVSLLDIKPTVLELAHLPVSVGSGISLAKQVRGEASNRSVRHFFTESDFSPVSIRTIEPDAKRVLLDGIDLFQINSKTTRLSLKTEMNTKIIQSKQYADRYGKWVLAFYPQNAHHRMPILVNLQTGEWTNDLHSRFATQSPAEKMLIELKAFFGEELTGV